MIVIRRLLNEERARGRTLADDFRNVLLLAAALHSRPPSQSYNYSSMISIAYSTAAINTVAPRLTGKCRVRLKRYGLASLPAD